MMLRFLPLLFLLTYAKADALAGAWEQFSTEEETNTWSLFAYADELSEPPLWAGTDENPYAYSFFLEGQGVWFFANEFTASELLVGDYLAPKISGIDVSVSVDPAELDFLDIAIFADGPNGPDYYYSGIYLPENLGTIADWFALSFPFDDDWYALEGEIFVPFRPDAAFLSSVGQVGVRFFPAAGVTEDSFVGIDDFILVPTDQAPELSPATSGGIFTLAFTPNPGLSSTIERLDEAGSWQSVAGQSGLTGPQNFTTPVDTSTALFRVVTEESLTPIDAE